MKAEAFDSRRQSKALAGRGDFADRVGIRPLAVELVVEALRGSQCVEHLDCGKLGWKVWLAHFVKKVLWRSRSAGVRRERDAVEVQT